jgi:tetratricopeptide (TPR) repeat protein
MNMLGLLSIAAVLLAGSAQTARDPVTVAQAQFEHRDYQAAVNTLSDAIAKHPDDARLWHWRSRCYLEQREYARAVADAERAVTARPDDSEYHRWLGRAYGAAAEHSRSFSLARKVRQSFLDAVRLGPSNIAARRDLAQFYVEAPWIVGGDRSKALAQIEAITHLDPVDGHLAHASYFAEQDKFDEAAAEYQRALDLRPNRMGPYLEAAAFYERRGDGPMLAGIVDRAALVGLSDPRLGYYKGVALIIANRNLAEAEQLVRSYVQTAPPPGDDPSAAEGREWLGRLYERQGNTASAADEYRAALALDPDRKSAREAIRRLDSGRRGSADRDRP